MCIFSITTPMRRKPIGKMHSSYGKAIKAAKRNAKRLGEHVAVEHWKEGKRATVFPDGTVVTPKLRVTHDTL